MNSFLNSSCFSVTYFVAFVQTQFNITIKTIRFDNGPEFILRTYYSTQGIHHQTSPAKWVSWKEASTPPLGARALLFQSNTPKIFRSYALSYIVHLINKRPKLLHYKCPDTFLYNDIHDYSNIKTFGCLVYACSHPFHKSKLDSMSRKCVYLGGIP